MTGPVLLQKLEAAAFAVLLALGLWAGGAGWPWVVAGLVLPDLSFAGYLRGPVVGARLYNCAHTWVGPAVLFLAAVATGGTPDDLGPLAAFAVAWALHIAVDRTLGYGLKLPADFSQTHLGRIGRGRAEDLDR